MVTETDTRSWIESYIHLQNTLHPQNVSRYFTEKICFCSMTGLNFGRKEEKFKV